MENIEEHLLFPLDSLLSTVEQEFLDFKQEHYKDNADFVHDILCLANAEHHGDRYIILGVEDETKRIIGVENDENRRNLESYINTLQLSNFNTLPIIDLKTFSKEEHELDIIIIKNKKKRPYFLLKDKRDGKKHVRAGVIYSRDGSCNTPKDCTAEPLKINNMWREHFGLDLTPLERFKLYIQEYDMWLKQPTSMDKELYYHKQFPEFTIEVYRDEEFSDAKHEPDWYKYKPVVPQRVKLCYFNTSLNESKFDYLDKEQCFFPFLDSSMYYICDIFPEKREELESARYYYENEFYFALRDDISYDLYELFRNIYGYQTIEEFASSHWAKMPIYVFNNLKEAKMKIKELGTGKIGISDNTKNNI